VIWTDAKGAVTFLNPAAQSWTGLKQEDAIGRPIEEVLRLRPSGVRALFENVLSQGILASLDEATSVIGEDGAERAIGGTGAPIMDHSGAVAGVVFVFGEPVRESAGIHETPDTATDQDGFAMVVESPAMRQLVSFARRVAKSEASTILIEGETGTGKDILAKYVHYHSDRRAKPFLAVNCAAIPETLLESELFGYEKGAFTDARQQKRGILELASGGTVFLDEVGEMPLGIQAKLLRVLEDQAFRRLGGLSDIDVDLRVITVTNRDLLEGIQDGRFRLDLYYRVNVIQLRIPPLRERNEDILPLADHFLRLLNRRFKRQIQGISPAAAEVLLAHNWPGNAREIRNTIERAMILEESSLIRTASLDVRRDSAASRPLASQTVPVTEGMSLGDAERAMLVRSLERANWNQSRAARALSITRDTLRYKMKKYGLFEAAAAAG
jgi:two-component system response regulator AtoC